MGVRAAARPLTLRESVRPEDRQAVMDVAASSGFFSPAEVEMAGSLVEERLRDGEPSGYFFVFAEDGAGAGSGAQAAPLAGFACYGPATYAPDWVDLYWIAVHQSRRGAGVGGALLELVERRVRGARPTTLVAETSSRGQYRPTRAFYEHKGFSLIAMMKSFYAPGEHKIIYAKRLEPPGFP
ncbi:GNAT family N-acetyltransferase [Desulfocurvus sp.]|uniref:GNAT family N-acetyltransferase n=1 Tax=Desulfocurvus sp. TaxID=2871698 RepID=UPI0025B99E73|nr:GNAT family N-acetyltransferase [Desulfocurvus sp.]MCK9239099.1 GNAT family N-acetyltransferase [Desulfocurvus sp.]